MFLCHQKYFFQNFCLANVYAVFFFFQRHTGRLPPLPSTVEAVEDGKNETEKQQQDDSLKVGSCNAVLYCSFVVWVLNIICSLESNLFVASIHVHVLRKGFTKPAIFLFVRLFTT